MKTFELDFRADALKEWRGLDRAVREQFRKKLIERLAHPHVPSSRLSGLPNCYKIKLRRAGYRLIYQVEDEALVILVIAIGKRTRCSLHRGGKSPAIAVRPAPCLRLRSPFANRTAGPTGGAFRAAVPHGRQL